jgi:hypothetical protein
MSSSFDPGWSSALDKSVLPRGLSCEAGHIQMLSMRTEWVLTRPQLSWRRSCEDGTKCQVVLPRAP